MSVSPQVQLVQEFVQGFQKKDLALFEKCLHKDYRHITYPKSINQQAKNKDEFMARLRLVLPKCTEIVSTTHSIIEAPGKVIIHLTNQLKTTSGELDPPIEVLIIATITSDDEGTLKLKLIEEFVDSRIYMERIQAFGLA